MIDAQCPPPKVRRNNPVLALLTDDQKQQLVDLCQTMSYKEAAVHARENLNIKISAATLSNLCTNWQIRDDTITREDLEATHNTSIENLTQQQLQLRLLELASRPNMDTSELRAICHSFARIESVKLSERRVQLAEAKEARAAKKDKPKGGFSPEKCTEGVRVLFGKTTPEEDARLFGTIDPQTEADSSSAERPTTPPAQTIAHPLTAAQNPQSEIQNPQSQDPANSGVREKFGLIG